MFSDPKHVTHQIKPLHPSYPTKYHILHLLFVPSITSKSESYDIHISTPPLFLVARALTFPPQLRTNSRECPILPPRTAAAESATSAPTPRNTSTVRSSAPVLRVIRVVSHLSSRNLSCSNLGTLHPSLYQHQPPLPLTLSYRRSILHWPRRQRQHRCERFTRPRRSRQGHDPARSDKGGEVGEPSLRKGWSGKWYVYF